VAMPDERLGERACAFVVRDPGFGGDFGLAEVREYLDGHEVSKFYWPERVETIDEMPRTPSGKIQKFILRDRAKGLRPEPHQTDKKEPVVQSKEVQPEAKEGVAKKEEKGKDDKEKD